MSNFLFISSAFVGGFSAMFILFSGIFFIREELTKDGENIFNLAIKVFFLVTPFLLIVAAFFKYVLGM